MGVNTGTIRAAHAAATTVTRSGASSNVGGLVGVNQMGTIIASYAASSVASSGAGALAGYLAGRNSAGAITNSYWNSTLYTLTSANGSGRTTSQLQAPTGSTGIYSGRNQNVDGVDGGDCWVFGSGSQYPVLKYRLMDYDADNDNLIDITTLAQLNAIRHDLNGNGDSTHADYASAFPRRQPHPAGRMGCAATCAGYELMADLDFDTDASGTVDSSDEYPNWSPIGTYTATFKGNNHTIANLTINAASAAAIGLFSIASGAISGVGLPDASVTGAANTLDAGALVGTLDTSGSVTSGWATGSVTSSSATTDSKLIGGLVGYSGGHVRASYSGVSVTATSTGSLVRVGGLAGLASTGSSITASYATGTVTSGGQGLMGAHPAPR